MKVRAKFQVQKIEHHYRGKDATDVAATITLNAVYGDGKGNEDWSRWTPQGKIEMLITNPTAIERFDLGGEYFVDFTPAE